ncbi:hypothetical protein MP228_011659 [Amoeboaphelidium protococcarum]|nr:hypothetical protein MP228_011659 [Amoeboaphelidium protococcarum]
MPKVELRQQLLDAASKLKMNEQGTVVTAIDGSRRVEVKLPGTGEFSSKQVLDSIADNNNNSISDDQREQKDVWFIEDTSDDSRPVQILDHLYVGSVDAAFNLPLLVRLNIRHIISAIPLKQSPQHDDNGITITTIRMDDVVEQQLKHEYIQKCNEIILAAQQSGCAVLVNCYAGVSRSVSLVIAHLITVHDMDYDGALSLVRSKRKQALPNTGFQLQLRLLSAMPKILDELCKDPQERVKFDALAEYFHELDVVDLIEIDDPDDMVGDVLPCHRLLMRVFIKKYLIPLHQRSTQPLIQSKVVTVNEDGIVRVCGQLVPTFLASASQKRMTVPRFHNWLVEGNDIPKSKLRFIDMSMNNLMSSDMKYISAMVEELSTRNLINPSGLILDLSSNRVHGIAQYREEVDGAVKTILSCPSVAFLDLRSNPFSSVDRRDYFQSITTTSPVASKLIWVHDIHLPTHGWRGLVPDDVVNVVLESHSKYFAWRKENHLLN